MSFFFFYNIHVSWLLIFRLSFDDNTACERNAADQLTLTAHTLEIPTTSWAHQYSSTFTRIAIKTYEVSSKSLKVDFHTVLG